MVARPYGGIGGRVEMHLAGSFSNRENDDAEFAPDLHFFKRLTSEGAAVVHAHLFDARIEPDFLSGEIQKLLHVRFEKRLRHSMPGAVVRSKYEVGSGAAQLVFRFFLGDAGRKKQLRVEGLRRENQKQVIRVRGEGGDEATGAIDSDVAQSFVPAGVGENGQEAGLHRALDTLLVAIHDYELRAGVGQFVRGAAAHAPVSAKDDVALQFIDHIFDTSLSEKLIQLQFDHGLRHGADRQQHDDDAEQDQEAVEDAACAAERVDLAIAHRGYGGEGHVKRVEHRIVFNHDKPNGATG